MGIHIHNARNASTTQQIKAVVFLIAITTNPATSASERIAGQGRSREAVAQCASLDKAIRRPAAALQAVLA
jgi:hypothetical protein